MAEEKNSYYLDQALDLLSSVKGKDLDTDDRYQKSLELAELIILHTKKSQYNKDKKENEYLTKSFMSDKGKIFFSNLLDFGFRSKSLSRVANQLSYLLRFQKVPKFFPLKVKISFFLLKHFAAAIPNLTVPIIQNIIKKQSYKNLIFADSFHLHKFLSSKKEDVTLALITKPAFGMSSVENNLREYLRLLLKPDIESICVKISNLSSNLYFHSWDLAFKELETNLSTLFEAAIKNPYRRKNEKKEKFIILNSEMHQNLDISVNIFETLLLKDKFLKLKAGISLPSYFPEAFLMQKRLTAFAKKRKEMGGAPIVISIIKGANLNLEQIKAAKNTLPSPTYITKIETDANFKKMINFGFEKENAEAAHISINTLNIFDIAYAMLLIKEKQIEPYVHFEIIRGLFCDFKSTISKLSNNAIKLFVPVVFKKDFHLALPYMLTKINESSNPENFIAHLHSIMPGSKIWEEQTKIFKKSLNEITKISSKPKLYQNREERDCLEKKPFFDFENESITNFSIKANREWAKNLLFTSKNFTSYFIFSSINGKDIGGFATEELIEEMVKCAKNSEKDIQKISLEEKDLIFSKVLELLEEKRDYLIKALMFETSKSIQEADFELLMAQDSINYLRKEIHNILSVKNIEWLPKGTFLSLPSIQFPICTLIEQITGALITSNTVIVTPSKEIIKSTYKTLQVFWEAGFSKKVLQFATIKNELFEKKLLKDKRINSTMSSTSSKNAKKLLHLREGNELFAECGGINSIIVTQMADKTAIIRDIILSAFDFSGQKLSSAAVLILEKEVYEDFEFLNNLKDAASTLTHFNTNSTITPLVQELDDESIKAFTTLGKDEKWLLEPKIDKKNPKIITPGIKLSPYKHNLIKENELYAPLLTIIKVIDLDHAVAIANTARYALTAGIYSLDIREQNAWLKKIHAGNAYINSKITNAKVRRQPFGGYKESGFGLEFKTGGPNYLLYFLNYSQKSLPKGKLPVNEWVNSLTTFLEKIDLSANQLGLWYASVSNYAYWWKRLKLGYDTCKILGQDNILKYVARKFITLRLEEDAFALDALRVCAAALTCSMPLEISWTGNRENEELNWVDLLPIFSVVEETREEFIKRVKTKTIKRIRLISPADDELKKAAAKSACCIMDQSVLANGRFELLYYIREICITDDYHRYGNLGIREAELRKPVL